MALLTKKVLSEYIRIMPENLKEYGKILIAIYRNEDHLKKRKSDSSRKYSMNFRPS